MNPPTADPTIAVPLASTGAPLQPSGFTTHPPASLTATPVAPSAPAASQSTDEETTLIFRLFNHDVPPADITRVVAAMSGRDQTTVEDAELLRRLYNLNVPAEDINLIVGAMQRRGQSSGVARDNIHGDTDIGREADPPEYDFKER
jgi:hypothetical protein